MAETLFSIQCETCRASLKVRDRRIIGNILACPKCESMVQIVAPEGWQDKPKAPATIKSKPAESKPAAAEKKQPKKTPPALPVSEETQPASSAGVDLLDHYSAADTSPEAPLPQGPIASDDLTDNAIATSPQNWVSPTEQLAGTWIKHGLSAIAGIVITLGIFFLFAPSNAGEETQTPNVVENDSKDVEQASGTSNKTPAVTDNRPKESGPVAPPPVENKTVEDKKTTNSKQEKSPKGTLATKKENDADVKMPPVVIKKEQPKVVKTPQVTPDEITERIFGDLENLPKLETIVASADNDRNITEDGNTKSVDIQASLRKSVSEIKCSDTPLTEVLSILQRISAIPFSLDVDSLQLAGISPNEKISFHLQNTTVAAVLEVVEKKLKLEHRADDDHLWLTVEKKVRLDLHEKTYAIDEIFGDDQQAIEQFVSLITKWIAPESWKTEKNKAKGAIQVVLGRLAVNQTAAVHAHIGRLIKRLKIAKKGAGGIGIDTRRHLASDALSSKVTLYYSVPTLLTKIVDSLEQKTNATILIDWQSLTLERFSRNTKARLSAKQLTLPGALKQMLQPLGLTFRIIDTQTVLITSIDAAQEHYELEIYAVKDILKTGIKASELQLALAHLVGEDNLNENSMFYEPMTQCLCILQNQTQQIHIEKLLDIAHSHRQKIANTAAMKTSDSHF